MLGVLEFATSMMRRALQCLVSTALLVHVHAHNVQTVVASVQAAKAAQRMHGAAGSHREPPRQPHLVHVVVDDLGWHNTQLSNPEVISPNIVALQRSGITLERHYVYRYCSPTRCSLLSGRLPHHVSEANFQNDYVGGFIHRNMTTIAAKLKAEGYRTAHVGKWHAGMSSPELVPTARGFDSSLGYLAGAEDHWDQRPSEKIACSAFPNVDGTQPVDLLHNGRPATGQNGTSFGGYLWEEEALRVVREHPLSAPLYLYYAFQDCHSPQQAPVKYTNLYPQLVDRCSSDLSAVAHWPKSHCSDCGVSTRRVYNAMLSFADDALGNLTTVLRSRGMWANTLLIWHSDNGGPSGSSSNSANNFPLRGSKYSDFEGGVRVRAFAAGGLIPEHRVGVTVKAFMHVCDWYATFLRLAGSLSLHDESAAVLGLPQPDSIDAWDVLMGTANRSRTEVPLSVGDASSGAKLGSGGGLIVPPFKILLGNQTPQGYTPKDYPSATHNMPTFPLGQGKTLECGSTGCLFDIINDPNETHNLAAQMPAKLDELRARFREIAQTKYQTPGLTPPCASFASTIDSNGGFWAPFNESLPYPLRPGVPKR